VTLIDFTINLRTKRKIYGIIGAVVTLIVPFLMMLTNGNNHLETEQSFCPFKMLTGFPCPGCGITKSLVYFYQGDLYKCVRYHILGPFVIVFCVFTILILTTEILTKKEYLNSFLYNRKLAYSFAIFLFGYHLIRLIHFITNNSSDAILHQSIWN
jgi:hypothetical protein